MKQRVSAGRNIDLTEGPVARSMWTFALPLIAGNLLQQFYNVADTLIVGRFLGPGALAAVGSSYTVMTFLTSVILGLCMGSGVLFSMLCGAGDTERMKNSFVQSFLFIGLVTALVEALSLIFLDPMMGILKIPSDILEETGEYLQVIFMGLMFTFVYNYFAALLRALGNSVVPLLFLAVSALGNIVLDLVFILKFHMGTAGAAWATILAQFLSALGIGLYVCVKMPHLLPGRRHFYRDRNILKTISRYSILTCAQQSVMNFGILMVQGLVNSYGVTVMAAFAAAVKIDSFAYMPVQDFGNAFSTFIAQNQGAGKTERIRLGLRAAVLSSGLFCLVISAVIVCFAGPLMTIFISPEETEIIRIGVQYLHIEGACLGIAACFCSTDLPRPGTGRVSVVLTIISLGTRVALAYLLSPVPAIGLLGIWWAVPIGWFLADAAGFWYFWRMGRRKGV
ncbi:MAG: MATE family efflux transporter [Clostridium sp.]